MTTYSNVLKTMYRGQMPVRKRSKLIKKNARVKKNMITVGIQDVGAVGASRCVAVSACEGRDVRRGNKRTCFPNFSERRVW